MSSPFKITGERTEERTCETCGQEFTATIIQVESGAEYGAGVTECDTCSQRREAAEAEERRLDEVRERVMRSGLPRPLRDTDFSGFAHTEAVEAAKRWAVDGGGLCLVGPVGVGKTRLAAAATRARLEGAPLAWVPVARLMTQLRAGFSDEARIRASHLITSEGGIVLDDIDKANPTEYGREVIFAVIDGRVEAGAPLLITTNLMPSQLGERLGEPVKSRIAGHCDVYEMSGEDRRLES